MNSLLIYLHGLNSSPDSLKARQTVNFLQKKSNNIEIQVPLLSTEPDEVTESLKALTEDAAQKCPVYIIGSSLGGYLGTWLHQHLLSLNYGHPVKLVLINPAVKAYNLFEDFIGPQVNLYTGEKWELTHRHAEQLKELDVDELESVDSILLLAQKGDEVLDYRLAEEKYARCRSMIQDGGDHSFIGYEDVLPDIYKFLTERGSSMKPRGSQPFS